MHIIRHMVLLFFLFFACVLSKGDRRANEAHGGRERENKERERKK